MSNAKSLIRGYNEMRLSRVLIGATDLVSRAARLYGEIKAGITPPAVAKAFRAEAALCLAEAEELIAAVRAETGSVAHD